MSRNSLLKMKTKYDPNNALFSSHRIRLTAKSKIKLLICGCFNCPILHLVNVLTCKHLFFQGTSQASGTTEGWPFTSQVRGVETAPIQVTRRVQIEFRMLQSEWHCLQNAKVRRLKLAKSNESTVETMCSNEVLFG